MQLRPSPERQSLCPFCNSETFTAQLGKKMESPSSVTSSPSSLPVAKATPEYIPRASVQDRKAIEEEIQTQRNANRRASEGMAYSGTTARRMNQASPGASLNSSDRTRLRAASDGRFLRRHEAGPGEVTSSARSPRRGPDIPVDDDAFDSGDVDALRALMRMQSSQSTFDRTFTDINQIEEMMLMEVSYNSHSLPLSLLLLLSQLPFSPSSIAHCPHFRRRFDCLWQTRKYQHRRRRLPLQLLQQPRQTKGGLTSLVATRRRRRGRQNRRNR